ncbi:hypothetical protein [Leptospira interrogans]|uniref:hypothetical protein n=1 Tax=Leptospira interrogans TaxID=173 RepID=UPI0002BB35A4|nr:hypothetical protein [Leptospira interrogans]QOI36811.1 hypothetical protein LeptoLang_21740 [Leptospira interrogans serovar Icterohaemorrhagiae]
MKKPKTNHIKQIYNLLYSPLITPENLVDNLREDTYTSIHFYKTDEGIIVEVNAMLSNEIVTYSYYFDKQELLQSVKKGSGNNVESLFNRSESYGKSIRALKQ